MDEPRQDDRLHRSTSETRSAFIAALARGDAAGASAVYAETAVLLPPMSELLRGRVAIEAFWKAGIDAGLRAVVLEMLELAARDGLAYEIGCYALQLTPSGGKPITDRGKYLLVHERQADGIWKRAVEMFNPNGKDH